MANLTIRIKDNPWAGLPNYYLYARVQNMEGTESLEWGIVPYTAEDLIGSNIDEIPSFDIPWEFPIMLMEYKVTGAYVSEGVFYWDGTYQWANTAEIPHAGNYYFVAEEYPGEAYLEEIPGGIPGGLAWLLPVGLVGMGVGLVMYSRRRH